MCAICGLALQNNSTVVNTTMIHRILCKLLINCQDRGKSATGIAIANNKNIKVIKNNLPAKEFVKSTELKKALKKYISLSKVKLDNFLKRPIQIIGHCRMPTKGSPLNNKNNHPIVTDSFVGVHNGVIGNDDELFDKYKKSFKRSAEVDSEIIFKLIEKYYLDSKNMTKAILSANSELIGSSACAFITTYDTRLLWLFRNNGPITILHYKDVGVVMFASSRNYVTDAVKGFSMGTPDEISIAPHEGVSIDLFNNDMHHFSILKQTIGYA